MLFGVVTVGGRGWVYYMAVLIVEREGAVLGVHLRQPFVTNWDGDALFPNYFGGGHVKDSNETN